MSVASTSAPGAFDDLLDLVLARPGLTYAAAATALGGRRTTTLTRLRAAVAAGVVHEGGTLVPSRGGAPRGARGLFSGPAPARPAQAELVELDLRQLRAAAGVSREAVAEQLGVSPGLLYRWETGRQPMPAHYAADIVAVVEDAQARVVPIKRRDAGRLRYLLLQVRQRPGVTRAHLAGRRRRDRQLLELARRSGQIHERTVWIGEGSARQPVVGLFPGARPRTQADPVYVNELQQARLSAGWTLSGLARHMTEAGTPVSGQAVRRWEQEAAGQPVPGWAQPAALVALAKAQATVRPDVRAAALEVITAAPGISRTELATRLHRSRPEYVASYVAQLLAADLVHERHAGRHGQRTGLYPGPAPAVILSPAGLVELRTHAGLTQLQLAEQVGTHVQAVRDWERQARPLSIDWQQRLRAHLEAAPVVDPAGAIRQKVIDALAEGPRTRHQLELLELGTRGQVSAALAELLDQDLIHEGPLSTVPDARGRIPKRRGYLLGPAPGG